MTIDYCRQIDCDSIGVGRSYPPPGSPSYRELKNLGKTDPRKIDWDKLGNFSLADGLYFADTKTIRFRKLLAEFMDWHFATGHESLKRINKSKNSVVVKSCLEVVPQAKNIFREERNTLRRLGLSCYLS